MGNCLVQSLKAIVENENLEILGGFDLKVKYAAGDKVIGLAKSQGGSVTAKFVGDTSTIDIVIPSDGTTCYTSITEDGVLQIRNKYSLKRLQIGYLCENSINTAQLQYCTDINHLELKGGALKGDISNISNLTQMTALHVSNNTELYGDIKSLGTMTSLVMFSLTNTHISGTIESFVKESVKNGRSTGNISFSWNLGDVTFNGNTVDGTASSSLSWSPNSVDNTKTDVTLDGTTITI